MGTMLQNPELIDPLHDFTGLSLLPRTFEGLSRSDNRKQDNVQSVLEALAVASSRNVVEQAKTVLKSRSELQNSESSRSMHPICKDQDIPPRGHPQERRPGLGRKRARFSLRPSTSQPSLDGAMSQNLDQYSDPDEYFRAFEKIERAEKELRKQRGEVLTDSSQHILFRKARSRRPGLGREAGKRQRFSSVVAEVDEILGLPQKLSEADISSPSNSSLKLMTIDEHGAQVTELAGDGCKGATQDSVAEGKNNLDDILNELLSKDCTQLDGVEATDYLRQRLQIPSINVDKLCLPEVDSVRKSDVKLSLQQLSRPRKSLSKMYDMSKSTKSKGSLRTQQHSVNSTCSPDSPTPPRSPFSSKYMLSRNLSEAHKSGHSRIDDISPVPVDGSEREDPLLDVDSDSGPAEVHENESNSSEKLAFVITEKNPADNNMVLDKVLIEDSSHALAPVDNNPINFIDNMNISIDRCDGGLEDIGEDMQQQEVVDKENKSVECNLFLDKFLKDDSVCPPDPVEDMVEYVQQLEGVDKDESYVDTHMVLDKLGADVSSQLLDPIDNLGENDNNMDLSSNRCDNGVENKFEDMEQIPTVSCKQAEVSSELITGDLHRPLDISGPTVDGNHASYGHPESTVILPEQDNQVLQESPRESLSVQIKQKDPSRNGRKRQVSNRKSVTGESLNVRSKPKTWYLRGKREVSSRKSLAGAGTQWLEGRRQSSRIRRPPLEYWRGERFLYGRVHESLVTVIGRKYSSPTKGVEKPRLKVESFVSDNYKYLVEKAAV